MTFHGYAGANGIERGVERVQGQVVPKRWVQTAFHGGESEMACNGRVCVRRANVAGEEQEAERTLPKAKHKTAGCFG